MRARGVKELTVLGGPTSRLLSVIAGACAATRREHVDAQISRRDDGLAL